MTRLHTHYDNLKVSRDAPQEVIRASYKALAQKYHPDKNNGDPEANRITATINMSYQELSNPKLRREHDKWIASEELRRASRPNAAVQPEANPASAPPPPPPTSSATPMSKPRYRPAPTAQAVLSDGPRLGNHLARFWYLYLLVGFFAWVWNQENSGSSEPSGRRPGNGNAQYSRPLTTPDGQSWPSVPSYVSGYAKLNRTGLSSATVDNSRLESDVLVKLVSLDAYPPVPVRTFFIPAGASFKAGKITPGRYDVRYRDLQTGGLSRSEAFTLTETEGFDGTQFSNITMTLYKVRNGNMKTYGLGEADF